MTNITVQLQYNIFSPAILLNSPYNKFTNPIKVECGTETTMNRENRLTFISVYLHFSLSLLKYSFQCLKITNFHIQSDSIVMVELEVKRDKKDPMNMGPEFIQL